MEDNKLVLITQPKTFHFDLRKDARISLKHQIYSTINQNVLLIEYNIKSKIRQSLSTCKHGNDIHEQRTIKQMNHTNSFSICHKD